MSVDDNPAPSQKDTEKITNDLVIDITNNSVDDNPSPSTNSIILSSNRNLVDKYPSTSTKSMLLLCMNQKPIIGDDYVKIVNECVTEIQHPQKETGDLHILLGKLASMISEMKLGPAQQGDQL